MKGDDAMLDACGCCDGLRKLTPVSLENLPGLSALAYRVGTHGSFKVSMKAALAGQAALEELTRREDDDPAIALLDAWATVLDVLTFYEERIANEGFLRTATERSSLLELGRSIGYELRPGVAASTDLAFELETAPGAPEEVTISRGTKVQSLPGPDEKAQPFETIEPLRAHGDWNGLKPRTKMPQMIDEDTTKLYLEGTVTQLQVGDALLFVGKEREGNASSAAWDLRILQEVAIDREEGYTVVRWKEELEHSGVNDPAGDPAVFALRQRAALFGHNAPDPRLLALGEGKSSLVDETESSQWNCFSIKNDQIDLDAVYPKILEGSWLVLKSETESALFSVEKASTVSRSAFALSAKITRLEPGLAAGESVESEDYPLRETEVLAQSEALNLAQAPLTETAQDSPMKDVPLSEGVLTPVEGDRLVLEGAVSGLLKGHRLIVSGRPSRVRVEAALLFDDGTAPRALEPREVLTVVSPPEDDNGLHWHLQDRDGAEGFVEAEATHLIVLGADEDADEVAEVVSLREDACLGSQGHTVLKLDGSLARMYDRRSVTIYANIARATHGETKEEVVGSGDGSRANQAFVLKNKPLTFQSSSGASGGESTLELRVGDVLWEEVPSLYGRGPREQVYMVRMNDDGAAQVQFGDGRHGARLPSGVENVTATYRVGTGSEGLLEAGQLSLLMTRHLGTKGVSNPLAPTGAEDPETRDQARQNAPLTILTLDRIVSLQDYEDFARAFSGIGKAQATWLWDGEERLVHLTVAAAGSGEVDEASELYKNLVEAIVAFSPPQQHVLVASYEPLSFTLSATISVKPRYKAETVEVAVRSVLSETFSFARRDFGQQVTAGEVMAAMQRVEGVEFVRLKPLEVPSEPVRRARWDDTSKMHKPAQLLTVDPTGIDLGVTQP
jgi:hypothetical protein